MKKNLSSDELNRFQKALADMRAGRLSRRDFHFLLLLLGVSTLAILPAEETEALVAARMRKGKGSAAPPVTPGSQTYSTVGTHSFTIPAHNTLKVELWGAGGGGGSYYTPTQAGGAGGAATWNSTTLVANGGGGGAAAFYGAHGAGGTATGGTTNTTGAVGAYTSTYICKGGKGANGGNGGISDEDAGNNVASQAPGGGGAGMARWYDYDVEGWGGTGGGGGYCMRTYASGVYSPGTSVQVVVPSGGTSAGGVQHKGAIGRVIITWT